MMSCAYHIRQKNFAYVADSGSGTKILAVQTKAREYIDIGDASGPTLKIKLMPPANFWMIDRLAVDYGKDLPIEVSEVAPESAVVPGLSSETVLGALAEVDGRYLDVPSPADEVELTCFPSPLKPGLTRSVF